MRLTPVLALALIACSPVRASFSGATHIPLPPAFRATAVAVADMNADGHTDIVVAGESQAVLILFGNGKGSFRRGPVAAAGQQPFALVAADVNGDGKRDVVIANHETDHVTALLGAGQGRFTSRQFIAHSRPHVHAVAVADVDNDHRPDIIVDSWEENRLTLLLGADGWKPPGLPIEIGRKPYSNFVAADLDGDGNVDLIVPNAGSGTVSVLLGNGKRQFRHAAGSPFRAGAVPFTVAAADLDGDGDADIAVANYSGHPQDTANDGLTWIRNDGGGRFTPFPRRVAAGTYSARLAAGKINRDRFYDVAFSNSASDNVTVVYGSASGPRAFENVHTMRAPHAVGLGDLNEDGRADLVVTSEESPDLFIFLAQ